MVLDLQPYRNKLWQPSCLWIGHKRCLQAIAGYHFNLLKLCR